MNRFRDDQKDRKPMEAITLIRPRILIFTHDDHFFHFSSFETQVRLDDFGASPLIQASTPAQGLFILRHETHVRIVAVDQVADAERPWYRKLHLIRDIHSFIARRFPLITVGAFEPDSFKRGGATHVSRRDELPIILCQLFREECERWSKPADMPTKKPKGLRAKPQKRRRSV